MGTPPISLCDTGEVDKSITLNGFFGSRYPDNFIPNNLFIRLLGMVV